MTETEAAERLAALEAKVRELERERAVLRESEHRLRTVLDILPVGVWFTDASGKIVLGNPAGQRVWAGARYVGVEQYGEYRGWRADTGKRIAAEEWALARALRGETNLDEVIDIECFDGSRRTILNVDAGDSLAEILELEGHRVRVARDGSSGVALAKELKPDFVLCDIGLPDVSGYEVAHALRGHGALRGIRLIAVSGYAQPEDVRRAAEAGFDGHVAKPPTLERLHEVLAGG